jgi:foldase protein PrsA
MQLRHTFARLILPLALASFVAAGCSGGTAFGGIPDNAVCAVDGTAITKKEFNRMFGNAKQQYEDNGRDFPKKGSDEYDSLRSDLVEYLVQQRLIENQASKFGIKVSQKDIDKGVKDLKQQVAQGDEKKFKEEMKRVNYTLELVKQDVKFDVISKKLYERVVKDIKVSDKDAKEYFTENPEQFSTKESREIAHILVKDKAKAEDIYQQVKGGDEKVFAKLAKQFTLDPSSKETGGVLPGGAVQKGQTVPEFDKTAFALKTGEVSQPVKTSYGWHVIAARGDIQPASTKKFDDVKGDIKKQLKGEQEGERYTEWNTDVRKDAEDKVECRKGYVWKQTVTETEAPEGTPAPAPVDEEAAAGDDEKSGDAKKADDEKAGDDEKSGDDTKSSDDEKSDDDEK